jgi:hypothetical protein
MKPTVGARCLIGVQLYGELFDTDSVYHPTVDMRSHLESVIDWTGGQTEI